MEFVRRSVMITEAQDRFLDELMEKGGINRSQAVRLGLDKLVNDPPVILTPRNSTRSGKLTTVRGEEQAS